MNIFFNIKMTQIGQKYEYYNKIVYISDTSFKQNVNISKNINKEIKILINEIIKKINKNTCNITCIGGEAYILSMLNNNVSFIYNYTNSKSIHYDASFNNVFYQKIIVNELVNYNIYNHYISADILMINLARLNQNILKNVNNFVNGYEYIIIINCHHDDFWKKIKILNKYKLIKRFKFLTDLYFVSINLLIKKNKPINIKSILNNKHNKCSKHVEHDKHDKHDKRVKFNENLQILNFTNEYYNIKNNQKLFKRILINKNRYVDDKFISLGCTCAVAYQLQKYGLRKESLPFDWSKTSINKIIKVLNNNFKNYTNLYFKKMSDNHKMINNSNKSSCLLYNDYNITFAHEVIEYNGNLINKFKNTLSNRVERFINLNKVNCNLKFVLFNISKKIPNLDDLIISLLNYFTNFQIIYIGCKPYINNKYIFYIKDIFIIDISQYYDDDWTFNTLNWGKIFNY